jgi:DNA polymerase III epsilon subunit-like protein
MTSPIGPRVNVQQELVTVTMRPSSQSILSVVALVALLLVLAVADGVVLKVLLCAITLGLYNWLRKRLPAHVAIERQQQHAPQASYDSHSADDDVAGNVRRDAWLNMTVAAIDVETTGLTSKTDRVIELAIIVARGHTLIREACWLVNPQIAIPKAASNVNGIVDGDVVNSPTFSTIAGQIAELLEGVDACIAYNAAFDRGFISAEFERSGIPAPTIVGEYWADPLQFARRVFAGESSHKLGDTARRLGIAQQSEHRAGGDAMTALNIWLSLLSRAPAFLIPDLPARIL